MDNKRCHKFWLVWSPSGGAPTRQHLTRIEADTEATRLAGLHPGRMFLVLKAVGGFAAVHPKVKPVEIGGPLVDDGIPF